MGRCASLRIRIPLLDLLDRRDHPLALLSVVTLKLGHFGIGFGAGEHEPDKQKNQREEFPRKFHIRVSVRICSRAVATARNALEEIARMHR